MKQILINVEELQTRVAVAIDGRLDDFFIERTDTDRLVGSIYKGRIRNLEASLQAAFVDVGAEKNAFLHYWDMLPATKEMLEDGAPRDRDVEEAAEAARGTVPGDAEEAEPPSQGLLGTLLSRLGLAKQVEAPKPKPQPQPKPKQNRRGRGRGRGRRRKKKGRGKPAPSVEDIPDLFKVNSEVLVQVTKGPIGTKGARVTTNLSIPGRYLVLLPNSTHVGVSKRVGSREERQRLRNILKRLPLPQGMGVICRTVGAGREEEHFRQDLAMLLDSWQELEETCRQRSAPCCVYQEPGLAERCIRDMLTEDVDEIVTDSRDVYELALDMVRKLTKQERVKVRHYRQAGPLFAKYRLTQQIESIFRRRVSLPGGGYICIDETEALIAIDVNSGKNRSGKDHPETILTTNLEAVEEVCRQLRLRNVGGLLVIDLIDMRSKKDQQTVYKALRAALARDRAKTRAYPISPLGLVEMTRQRENESVRNTVYVSCPYCEGRGLVKSATTMSVEIQRRLQEILQRQRRGKTAQLRVTVHPSVLERLRTEDAGLLVALEKEFGGELTFRADASLHLEEFQVADRAGGTARR